MQDKLEKDPAFNVTVTCRDWNNTGEFLFRLNWYAGCTVRAALGVQVGGVGGRGATSLGPHRHSRHRSPSQPSHRAGTARRHGGILQLDNMLGLAHNAYTVQRSCCPATCWCCRLTTLGSLSPAAWRSPRPGWWWSRRGRSASWPGRACVNTRAATLSRQDCIFGGNSATKSNL